MWRDHGEWFLSVAVLLTCLSASDPVSAQDRTRDNQLFQQLTQHGVQFPQELIIKLPEPSLVDGLDPEQQRNIIARVAGRYGWKQFVRESTVAPFKLKQDYVKDRQGQRVGHAIDLWFVAHAPLQLFQDPRRAEEAFDAQWPDERSADLEIDEFDDQTLSARGIKRTNPKSDKYVAVKCELFNKVRVGGVGHVQRSRRDESVTISWKIDRGFSEGERPANRWQPVVVTQLGRRKLGDARPYQGCGGYLKITNLLEPAGALLFEAHVVFCEPQEWFQGSNFLRAKIPLMARETVDTVRRRLARQ